MEYWTTVVESHVNFLYLEKIHIKHDSMPNWFLTAQCII